MHSDLLLVIWDVLILLPYDTGPLLTMRKYQNALRWIINMPDETVKLVRWSLGL